MSLLKSQVKRTYGSQARSKSSLASMKPSTPASRGADTGLTSPKSRKRPLAELFSSNIEQPPRKLAKLSHASIRSKGKKPEAKKAMAQLHFCVDTSILRTCPLCDLSYTRGAPDDESLHKAHCARVQKGMEWGREEDKEMGTTVQEIEGDVILANGEVGRIICLKAITSGKAGNKLSTFLKTVNLALSAPDMTRASMEASKVYIFLVRPDGSFREKMVGCAIAQRIETAMETVAAHDSSQSSPCSKGLIHVEGNLYCKPERLPTPLGIPRLFVSSAHRRKGIAQALLSAAARTFIHGCELEVSKGEVAFSQPTSAGRAVMEKWGKGGVRVFEE